MNIYVKCFLSSVTDNASQIHCVCVCANKGHENCEWEKTDLFNETKWAEEEEEEKESMQAKQTSFRISCRTLWIVSNGKNDKKKHTSLWKPTAVAVTEATTITWHHHHPHTKKCRCCCWFAFIIVTAFAIESSCVSFSLTLAIQWASVKSALALGTKNDTTWKKITRRAAKAKRHCDCDEKKDSEIETERERKCYYFISCECVCVCALTRLCSFGSYSWLLPWSYLFWLSFHHHSLAHSRARFFSLVNSTLHYM